MRRKSYQKRCIDKALALSKEKRQEFLDYMWEGMTIGEAREKAGLSLDEGVGVLLMNMEKATFLRRDSK